MASYFIRKCYFTIGNAVFKQNVGIPREIDPALFWENLFLSFDSKYVQQLISFWGPKAYSHHGTSRFIDDQCRANENAGFLSFRKTYPTELELEVEHQEKHVTYLEINITMEDGNFFYELFNKKKR